MNVPLLDLQAQYRALKGDLDRAVAGVFASAGFILGPRVAECEAAVAAYCGCRHGIGVSSGTDALLVCLMAEGIGPGHEVITSAYSFFATAGAVARVGATPVFADIDPVTFNLRADRVAAKITPRTKAIIPVHLYGQMAEMEPLMALAERHGLAVIEDACQAVGAVRNGRKAGSVGHYGCLSFYPTKNLSGAGDGGMVLTNDPARAARVVCLRNHGAERRYYHKSVGGNFRLDALQAVVVQTKLPHLDAWTARRQANAARYDRLFEAAGARASAPGAAPAVVVPRAVADRHVFNQYVIRVPRRDELRAWLTSRGIGTEVYYPVPLHLQECFRGLGYTEGDLPQSEAAARETLALPIYPELSDEQAAWVVESIAVFFAGTPH